MASAKKRVEMVMASKAKMQPSTPYYQINTHVEDPQKSLEELFSAGVRNEQQRKHYERKKNIPMSFSVRPPAKSRGSSTGHSREGSSDDGLGSSGRHTLSPSSVSSQHFGTPYQGGPVHTRQGSAPALINYGALEHQPSRQIAGPTHVPSKSLSVMTMSDVGEQFVTPVHRAAKSCDLEAEPNRHVEVNFTPDGQPFYVDQTQKTYWSEPRAKSQSLDPIAVGLSENPHMQQQQQQQQQQQPHLPHSHIPPNEPDDGLGPLPDGWMKSYDHNGDVYFIDHFNQTTTWYDPRVPRQLQEEGIRQRHACGRHNNEHLKRNAYDTLPDSSSSLVQQLQMERRDMQERQQQLCREGLIDPQWQNPHQYQAPISPMQQQSHLTQSAGYSPFCGAPPVRSDLLSANYYSHNLQRNISNDSAVENTMEVDYLGAGDMITPIQNAHHIDPTLVRDLTAQDLNPRDFDQYLQLNDNRSPAVAKQYR